MAAVRDRVAHRLANAALSLATPQYRDLIKGSILYGLAAAKRDHAAEMADHDHRA